MTRPLRRAAALALLLGSASCAGRGAPAPATHDTTTLPAASVAFTAKARELGALGDDDELLLLGQSFCGLAEAGPIDGYVAAYFQGLREEDRRQASFVFAAAATDLCPAHAAALTQAAAEVLTLG